MRNEPSFGRSGPTGSDAPSTSYTEPLATRNSPIFSHAVPTNPADLAKLPAERYGLVMVFRSFERAAFGLVLEATRPVSLSDILTNP